MGAVEMIIWVRTAKMVVMVATVQMERQDQTAEWASGVPVA